MLALQCGRVCRRVCGAHSGPVVICRNPCCPASSQPTSTYRPIPPPASLFSHHKGTELRQEDCTCTCDTRGNHRDPQAASNTWTAHRVGRWRTGGGDASPTPRGWLTVRDEWSWCLGPIYKDKIPTAPTATPADQLLGGLVLCLPLTSPGLSGQAICCVATLQPSSMLSTCHCSPQGWCDTIQAIPLEAAGDRAYQSDCSDPW